MDGQGIYYHPEYGAEPLILHFSESYIILGDNEIKVNVESGTIKIKHSELVIKAE